MTSYKTQEILPVLVSFIIILLIVVLQRQSRVVAAVTATMPVNITLGLWIVYVSAEGDQDTMTQFSQGLIPPNLPGSSVVQQEKEVIPQKRTRRRFTVGHMSIGLFERRDQ